MKDFNELSLGERADWDKLVDRAALLLNAAFILLALEIVLASGFMWGLLAK